MRHSHTSPFEMVELKFHVKLPIFVARQWIRHRTANVNEYSGRYSVMQDEFYVPDANQVRPQSKTNKQGRNDSSQLEEKHTDRILNIFSEGQSRSYQEYEEMLSYDLAREIARNNLPLSLYTEWYWKIDLHNLFHFLRLRLDSHAQYEIRVYAEAMAEMVKTIVPVAWEAFEDFVLYAERFSRMELQIIHKLLLCYPSPLDTLDFEEAGLSSREAEELLTKINRPALIDVLNINKQ